MNINLTPETITLGIGLLGTIITGAFAAGRLHHRIGQNEKDIRKVESSLDGHSSDVSGDIKTISSKLDRLIGKVSVLLKDSLADTLSDAHSPRQLNNNGRKVLADSSIEQVLEPLFDQIVESVRACTPENPYQAQESLFEVVLALKEDAGLVQAVENGAFLSGHTPEEVLYVGALNIRDRVIEELGLQVTDIDKHDPSKAK